MSRSKYGYPLTLRELAAEDEAREWNREKCRQARKIRRINK